MSQLKWCIALATGWLLAGCAAAPEQIAGSGAASDPAQAASTAAAETNPAAASAGAEAVAAAGAGEPPVVVVDAAQLAPSPNEGLVCREVLKPNSNVIVTACGTPEDWKKYERIEARNAAEITRMMQGSAFR